MKSCLLLLPFALAACTQVPGSTTQKAAVAATTSANTSMPTSTSTLAAYHWQLTDAVDGNGTPLEDLLSTRQKPLQLGFTEERLHVSHACNAINGRYKIVDSHLVPDLMMHTMMACSDPVLMQREQVITATLQAKPALIITKADGHPTLTLTEDSGRTLIFSGQPTAEMRYGGPAETVFLEVAAQTVPCPSATVADGSCLNVRDRHYDAKGLRSGEPGPWHPMPTAAIEGYTHEAGTRNVLRVKRYRIKQPAADAPSTAWVLDSTVESEIVPASSSTQAQDPAAQP